MLEGKDIEQNDVIIQEPIALMSDKVIFKIGSTIGVKEEWVNSSKRQKTLVCMYLQTEPENT